MLPKTAITEAAIHGHPGEPPEGSARQLQPPLSLEAGVTAGAAPTAPASELPPDPGAPPMPPATPEPAVPEAPDPPVPAEPPALLPAEPPASPSGGPASGVTTHFPDEQVPDEQAVSHRRLVDPPDRQGRFLCRTRPCRIRLRQLGIAVHSARTRPARAVRYSGHRTTSTRGQRGRIHYRSWQHLKPTSSE